MRFQPWLRCWWIKTPRRNIRKPKEKHHTKRFSSSVRAFQWSFYGPTSARGFRMPAAMVKLESAWMKTSQEASKRASSKASWTFGRVESNRKNSWENDSLGLKLSSEKVFLPLKPSKTTFLEGIWNSKDSFLA